MTEKHSLRSFRLYVTLSGILAFLAVTGLACNSAPLGSTGGTTDGTTDSGGDDNVLLNEALGYEGSVSGKVFDSQTTRGSIDTTGASQALPPSFDTDNTCVRFKDLVGNNLLDADGQPVVEVPVESDGSFSADGLPVGTDFTACVDVGSDGGCDIECLVNIPSRDGGDEGELTGVRADPLTTLVLSKLRRLIEEWGINPEDLPISPAAVVTRIVTAYTHLFEDAGIDQTLTLDDIEAVTRDELAALFDSVIPAGARTGMQIVEGNLDVARAADAEAMALAAAEVFLRAGFPIADRPGPPDLSLLAELEGITTISPEELFGPMEPFEGSGDGFPEEFPEDFLGDFEGEFPDGLPDGFFDEFPDGFLDEFPDGFPDEFPDESPEGFLDEPFIGLAEADGQDTSLVPEEIIYISMVSEPDRNFANAEGDMEGEGMPPLPVLNDHILVEMARLHLEGRQLTLGVLYELLTSLDDGLGARLTYAIHDPNFFGPPLMVFETADGAGKAIDIDRLFHRMFEEGFHDLDRDSFERRETELRALLRELLGDTVPPTFDRLFDAVFSERIPDAAELARRIREAKAHLPFSRSGPSAFFVVADGDPFRTDQPVSPVTVDADVDIDGHVLSVMYNEGGNGRYYLGFTECTEDGGFVELIVRETGRFLHGTRGPVRLSLFDESLFQPINGRPFADFVSESGTFYPGIHVTVISDAFVPGGDNLGPGPNEQIFALATGVGEGAEPVRVDYDRATGIATYNPCGRNLIMFLPDSHETGVFALFNEDTGRRAEYEDPAHFFEAPPELPENFEDVFNEVDEFDDYTGFNEFFEDPFDEFPDDGGFPPPPDGEMPPPPDGQEPPPDDQPVDPAAFEGEDTTGDQSDEPVVDDPDATGDQSVEPPPLDGQMPPPPDDPDGTGDQFVEPPFDGGFREPDFILVAANEIVGLDLDRTEFTHVFGVDVPNERHDPSGDPYFDDVNGNGVEDPGEPTTPFRPTLFDPNDWRSTDIRLYYRRADDGGAVTFEEVKFEAETPQTFDGVVLVPRSYLPRLNAFRFGRPNTAINMLTAFSPPEFFDGAHALDRETPIDVFSAVAIMNLVMDQVFNVEANVDIDGIGPLPRQRLLLDAHMFVAPLDDPFLLLLKGFRDRSVVE